MLKLLTLRLTSSRESTTVNKVMHCSDPRAGSPESSKLLKLLNPVTISELRPLRTSKNCQKRLKEAPRTSKNCQKRLKEASWALKTVKRN